jgi:hypothetical protein
MECEAHRHLEGHRAAARADRPAAADPVGYLGFCVGYASCTARPGLPARPADLARQPLGPLAITLAFWAVAALAEAFAIVLIVDSAGVRAPAVARVAR